MLSLMLNIIMLNVIMLNFIMFSVIILSVIMLNVMVPWWTCKIIDKAENSCLNQLTFLNHILTSTTLA
jgi:hypothetical protein